MAAIEALTRHIRRMTVPHPVRVAIDGRTASGKTTLANELARALRGGGDPVIRVSIDGFHNPKAIRCARGRHSAEGYFHDARDLDAVRRLLLDPLGPGGDRRYITASFDLEKDEPLDQEPSLAAPGSILIVDGTFLQRSELKPSWDLTVFVQVSEATAMQRGVSRDRDRLGSLDAAQATYAQRYLPAFDLYERLCRPFEEADVLIDNECFENPMITVRAIEVRYG